MVISRERSHNITERKGDRFIFKTKNKSEEIGNINLHTKFCHKGKYLYNINILLKLIEIRRETDDGTEIVNGFSCEFVFY